MSDVTEAKALYAELASLEARLSLLLERSLSNPSDDLNEEIARIGQSAQAIVKLTGGIVPDVSQSTNPPGPDLTPSDLKGLKRPDRSDFTVFIILFMAAKYPTSERTLRQSTLFELFCKFDPSQSEKESSFTAKLSALRRSLDIDGTSRNISLGKKGGETLLQKYKSVNDLSTPYERLKKLLQGKFGDDLDIGLVVNSAAPAPRN